MNTAAKIGLAIAIVAIVGALAYYFLFATKKRPAPTPTPPGPDDFPVHENVPFFSQAKIAKLQNGGYLVANNSNWFTDTNGFAISVDFAVGDKAPNALIWATNNPAGTYYLAYVSNGLCRFDCYTDPHDTHQIALVDHPSVVVNDGLWHTLRVWRVADEWTMQCDDNAPVSVVNHVEEATIPGDAVVQFGSAPKDPYEPRASAPDLTGCLRNIGVNKSPNPPEVYAHGGVLGSKRCVNR